MMPLIVAWSAWSNEMQKIILTLSLVAIAFLLRRRWKAKESRAVYPPGPRGLPIVGSLPFVEPNLHRYFARLARTYGPVLHLRLGLKPCVVVSSPSVAREMFKRHDVAFANHVSPAAIHSFFRGSPELLWSSYGPEWRMLRKIAATHVLNAGSIEAVAPLRMRELRRAVRTVWEQARTGKALELRELLFQTTLNTTTCMLFGERVDGEGKEFRRFIEGALDIMIAPNVADFFPFLAPLDPQGLGRQARRMIGWIDGYLNNVVERRKNVIAAGEKKKTDVLDFMLEFMTQKTDPQLASFTYADLRNLFGVSLLQRHPWNLTSYCLVYKIVSLFFYYYLFISFLKYLFYGRCFSSKKKKNSFSNNFFSLTLYHMRRETNIYNVCNERLF